MIKIYMGKILVFQICKLQIYPGKTFFIIFFFLDNFQIHDRHSHFYE